MSICNVGIYPGVDAKIDDWGVLGTNMSIGRGIGKWLFYFLKRSRASWTHGHLFVKDWIIYKWWGQFYTQPRISAQSYVLLVRRIWACIWDYLHKHAQNDREVSWRTIIIFEHRTIVLHDWYSWRSDRISLIGVHVYTPCLNTACFAIKGINTKKNIMYV